MELSIFPQPFPLIEQALKQECLFFADLAFAQMVLKNVSEPDQHLVGFICHLTLAAREGHLCVKIDAGSIHPSPIQLWQKSSDEPLSDELKVFLNSLSKGFNQLPDPLVTHVDESSDKYPKTPFCLLGQLLYLQKNWIFETHFLKHLKALIQQEPAINFPLDIIRSLVDRNDSLNQKQKEAVSNALQNSLYIISGGPGTGKSYTAGFCVQIFSKLLGDRQSKIALAAPTGKAAANLQSSLGEIENVDVHSQTLHSLLKMGYEGQYTYPPKKILPYDLILVDECSMIDVKMMASLFAAIKPGARVILLGDPFQLPAVEAGSLFSDMISVFDRHHQCRLEECLRVELEELVHFGTKLNEGKLTTPLPSCVTRLSPDSSLSKRKQQTQMVEKICSSFPSSTPSDEILDAFNRFRVLSPVRKGFFGVDEMNEKILQKLYSLVFEGDSYAVPIMITQNDYKKELFNGEVGVLIRKKGRDPHQIKEGDYAIFSERKIPALLLPKFDYAYCLSVHKSQGSEFEHVMLLLPPGSEKFGREVLYTAVTRARRHLTIWGEKSVLIETLYHRCQRYSGVDFRWSSSMKIHD